MRIEELRRKAAGMANVVPLGGGLPSALQFPRDELHASFARVLVQPGTPALQYGWPEGFETLRQLLAERMRQQGCSVDPGDVIVTSGAQQAIAIAAQVLCGPGAQIGVEPESYPAALELFRARGSTPGVMSSSCCAIYAMPAIDNPHGRTLHDQRRNQLVSMGVPIIEDDAYASLRFDGVTPRPLAADAPELVWYVGTFSKTLCPGLRVGWLVPPRSHAAAAWRIKRDGDLQSNGLAQAVVADYLEHNDFDLRLVALRDFYAHRARRLEKALSTYLPSWRYTEPQGGFSIWMETEAPCDELEFLRSAVDHGVTFDPGSTFRLNRSPLPTAMRVSFSFVEEDQLERGASRLADAWRSVRHHHASAI